MMHDSDAVMTALDRFDAGIVGEEVDGTLRVAFGRTCEMVTELVGSLAGLGKDLVFPLTTGHSLHLNIVPLFDCDSVDESVLAQFEWLPNQMGIYTLSKKALAGKSLRQLFAQIDQIPCILEDEPGGDIFYLHTKKSSASASSDFNPKTDTNTPNMTKLLLWVFVLTALIAIILFEPLHPHHEWVLKMLSTIYMKLPTFPSS